MELEGYSYQGFPNLQESRDVQSKGFKVRIEFPSTSNNKNSNEASPSIIRASLARLLFSYLDTEDILLAEQVEEGIKLIRVSLDKSSSREQLVQDLSKRVQDAKPLSDQELQNINQKLGISENQSPYVMSFSTKPTSHQTADWYPKSSVSLTLLSSNQLQLTSDESVLSNSTGTLFLQQLSNIITLFSNSPTDLFQELLSSTFDSSLLSIHSRPFDPSQAQLSLEWLYKNARERPQAIAHELYSTTTTSPYLMTYLELDQKSNQLARFIRSKSSPSFQVETSVGVCRNRDRFFYVAHAAIWKAGGCYVPIDTDLPPERKNFISKDSGSKMVLCSESQRDLFGDLAVVLESREIQEKVEKMDNGRLEEDYASLDSLAYLLYTSGTTGTPKGCLQMHRGVYWAIEAMVEMPKPITNPDTDKRLAMAAVAFDVHISEMAQSWALGTRLVSVESRLELLADLQENIINFGITHIGMVPSMMEATLTKPADSLPLKYMVSGGEKVSDAVLKKWAVRDDIVFANFYGPTEATVGCTSRRVKVSDRKENIGLSFPSCKAFVAKEVDGKLETCLRGSPGELIVEGALVGRGYLGRDEATKKAFVEWPEKGDRSYRTGDLVRMFPDGSIIIAGRIDSQIKLRGVRIESEGVSNVIRKASTKLDLDAVSVVTNHPQVGSSELLVTFVAPGDGRVSVSQRRGHPTFEKLEGDLSSILREASNKELASYMRPSHIVPVDFLPLSHNGKVDSKSLVALFQETSVAQLLSLQGLGDTQDDSGEVDREATEAERIIMEEMASIGEISIESLKPSSRLIESGLNSLQLATLTARLRSKFGGKSLTVTQVIGSESVEGCSRLLEEPSSSSSTSLDLEKYSDENRSHAEELFGKEEIESVLPQFPVQPGVLFQTTQQPQGYVQHFLYKCSSGIQPPQIDKAWKLAMESHEILRAVFIFDGSSDPLQVILKPQATRPSIQHHSLSLEEASSDSEFVALFRQQHSQAISKSINEDTSTPMWKVCLFNPPSGSKEGLRMSLSLNHSIYDAFAVRALMQGLDSILSESPRPSSSPPLADILQEIGISDSKEHREFWIEHLEGLKPILEARPPKTPTSNESTRLSRQFSIPFADIRSFCSEAGVTTQSFFNAAFALAGREMFGWDESGSALFGGVRSGRDLALEGINSAVCPLVSLVPTRVDLSAHDASDFLKTAQRSLLDSSAHDRIPLGQIQRWLGLKSLVEVLFSCRIEGSRASYQQLQHIEGTPPSPEFILAIEMLLDEGADSVEARAAFTSTDLEAEQVYSLLESLERTTRSLLERDTASLKLAVPSTSSGRPKTNGATSKEEPRTFIATEAEVEKVLSVVSSFLKLSPNTLSPTSSLVSFGLTSLRSVGLSRALGNERISLTPSDIIQADSARALAEVAASASKDGKDSNGNDEVDVTRIEKEASEELDLPSLRLSSSDEVELALCTPLQAGMLSQTISTPGSLYVHAFTLQLQSGVDIEQVKSAWSQAVKTFSILRSSFHFDSLSGRWVQVVHSVEATPLRWSKIEAAKSEDSTALAKRLVQELDLTSEQTFSTPPLYLFHVKRDGAQSVVAVLHHALYDGVSLSNLFRHVTSFYHKTTVPSSTPFSVIARDIARREERSTAYWSSRMSNCSVSHLPSRDSSNPSSKAWRATKDLGLRNVDDLHRVARRYQVTAQCVGQLALARVLASRSAVADVTFCQVVSGRTLQGAGEVIGPVFNTIPCRVELDSKITSREALRNLHRDNLESLSFQHASLRSIQQQLGVRSLGDALFVFQPRVQEEAADEPIWKLVERASQVDQSTTHFTLNVELHEVDQAFEVRASCAADVFSNNDLDGILDSYVEAISEIVYQPNKPVLPPGLKLAEPRAQKIEKSKPVPKSDGSVESFSIEAQTILDILATVMNVDKTILRSSSSLASLGLDSIGAIQVASRCRRAGYKLAPTDVVKASTVGNLLKIVESGSATASNGLAINGASERRDISEALLTAEAAQVALSHLRDDLREGAQVYRSLPGLDYLFSGWQRAGGRAFHLVLARKATDRLDIDRLKNAWASLIKRHSVLRSIVVPTSDQDSRLAVCIVSADHIDPVFMEEFSDSVEEEHQVRERAQESLRTPNSADVPSPRMVLVHGVSNDYVLIDMLHVHYDGWSMRPLLSDLEALYLGKEPSSAHNFEDLLLEAGSPSASTLTKQKSYWQGYLGTTFSPSLWNSTSSSSPILNIQHFHVELRDSTPKMADLQAASKRLGVSLSSLIISTWAQVQSERSSTPDSSATFGLVQNGRSVAVENIETLAAPSVNLVPIHVPLATDSSSSTSRAEAAQQIQRLMLERPNEIEQTRLVDVASWTGASSKPFINVSVNLLFLPASENKPNRTSSSNSDSTYGASKPFWEPFAVPESLPLKEQSQPIAKLFNESGLTFPEIQLDLRLVVASSKASPGCESRMIFLAEGAVQKVDEEQVSASLRRWTEILKEIVDSNH